MPTHASKKPPRSARFPGSPAALLGELVAIPSVHPEADAGGTVPGEAAVAELVAHRLRQLGADVRLAPLAPGRPSVIGVFAPAGRASATVLLAPHLDTVGVGGMTVPPFQLTRRAGRLHGRGACDTKGPMAALLWALHRWTRLPAPARGNVRWIFAATAGEEQGSLGARALMREGWRADFGVALEPTNLRVVSAAKGVLRVWAEAIGRAAHGSRPERGINAIERLLPFASALRDELAPALAARRHPLLGAATVNLGVFHGGGELNIVPDRARAGLDIRTHPQCESADVMQLLETLRTRVGPQTTLRIAREGPAFVTAQNLPWAKRLRRAGTGWAAADWFCDANIFAAHGIPSIAFGPGDIRQAHTRDEFITTSALDAGAAAFFAFLSGQRR